ncbi:MAG: Nramp family divalent metal transporter [Candidatus Eremiobacteraeota bacterium]|nr:Nramp family divalent metal transporter [Candidatus Eremiobacteraeota bacterium]
MEAVESVGKKAPLKRPTVWRSILLFLSIVGPGIITANLDNDAGGIGTYSQAGAQFGYGFLWLLIPVTLALIFVQEMCIRMGVVTGKGLADLIRERFGVRLTLFLMIGVTVDNLFTTVAEFAGVGASADIFHISRYAAVPVAAIFVALLVLRGDYKAVEKVFLAACAVYVTYIVSGLLAHPDWHAVARATFVPHVSSSTAYILMFLGVVGTTITPWMQFYIQSSVVEKGVKVRELRYSQIDVVTGCFITDIVAYFIIVACGATLYAHNIHNITDGAQAAQALAPLAGKYASLLFAVGLLNASLFSASVLPQSLSYTVCEAFGFESGVGKTLKEAPVFYGLYLSIIVLGALPILIPRAPLFAIIFYSQVVSGILIPAVIISMLILINDRGLMGRYTNGPVYNVVCWACASALIAATALYLIATVAHAGA